MNNKRFRLKSNHPVWKRMDSILKAFEDEGLTISWNRCGIVTVHDVRDGKDYLMADIEANDYPSITELPPMTEFSLSFETIE